MSARERWWRAIAASRAARWAAVTIVAALGSMAGRAGLRELAVTISLPERLTATPSTVVAHANGSPAHVFLSPDDKYRMAVTLDDVDPDYVAALIRFEDKRFLAHQGVDFIAVARSTLVNLHHGRVVTGASTLTMQLVRVLEPRPRTVRSKLVEMVRAMQLELVLDKQQVLEAYLTFAPFGRNVEGVEAACLAYFGHGARDLAPEEIAVLLAVPQRPARRHPSARNAERLTAARDEIAGWLVERSALSDGETEEAGELMARLRAVPVPTRLRRLPRGIPHAAQWLRARHPERTRLDTTLDAGHQRLVEQRLRRARAELGPLGIRDAAVVVVDHETRRVVALAGNFDFWEKRPGAQVVAFDEPRSPGSALKPFIYALAIDRGLALPDHLVADVPISFGNWQPDNYDGEFTGLVRLEDALSRSLNVPFVNTLRDVGVPQFLGALRGAGVASLPDEPGYHGLSAAIGSAELTPLELAGLYAALARDGTYRPLTWLAGDGGGAGHRLLSPGASYLTRRALARRDRPDFPSRRTLAALPSRIHWKTGTSYGHRDAWAAGSGPRHSVVVWLGNLDNSSSVDLVGSEAAGPILFDVLEGVADRSTPPPPDRPPPDLVPVSACAYSGHVPQAACPTTRQVLALRSQVPVARPCPYHVLVDVDRDTGEALEPGCRGGRRFETRTFVSWPAAIRRWLPGHERSLPRPPPLAAGCRGGNASEPPDILSPEPRRTIVLLPRVEPDEQEVPLVAEVHGIDDRVSWFVDGRFLTTVAATERAWWTPRPGRHELVAVDSTGASARRMIEVVHWQ